MAKIEGTQNIPSEWKTEYDGTITPLMPNGVIRKRYPWRLPKMQEGGTGVTEAQKKQRERIKAIVEKFKNITQAEKARWYDARPPWHSLLWYYNYFIMSGLCGNANINQGGAGVIKLIQHVAYGVGPGGGVYTFPTAINPEKAVIMAWGGAHSHYAEGDPTYAWAWNCFPVPKILNSTSFEVVWSEEPEASGNASFIIIEYI